MHIAYLSHLDLHYHVFVSLFMVLSVVCASSKWQKIEYYSINTCCLIIAIRMKYEDKNKEEKKKFFNKAIIDIYSTFNLTVNYQSV